VVVIDSVAALTPRAEIEGEMGDTHVGLQARLMSQALRKLTANLNKSDTIALFINQLREKIGVMFGCFSYNTRVSLADGTQERIGKIVNQKLPVEVLTYDHDRGEVVTRPVINWFDNGRTDGFLSLTVAKPGGNGRSQFACTPNHKVMTPSGWREAQELHVGDRILQSVPHHLSDLQWQAVLGGLMGDGALSPSRSGYGARFRWGHGIKQAAYGDWKASLFANLTVSRSTNSKGAVFHDVQPLAELAELRRAVYVEGKKVLSSDYLKRLTPLSLAIWYMDDGSFALRSAGKQQRTQGGSGRSEICIQAFDSTSQERLRSYLVDTWGIDARLTRRGARRQAFLVFSRAETDKLHALVAPFVHPSMDYKLLPRFRGRFAVEPVLAPTRNELMPLPILSITPKTLTSSRSTHRFDIEVDGTHNYFVDGVMVHNSPETTPGGRALKFYSSVRLDIRRIESIKDGVEVVGNRTRVKVVKNKCAPPFKQSEFDIMYGKGISREGSLLDVGVDLDLVKKSGAWYTYDGEQLGQGRENAKLFLAEHPEVMVEISERIRSQLGIGASGGLVDSTGDGDGGNNSKTAANGDANGNGKTGANGKTTNGDGTLSLDEPITLDD
jgi:recombination protein RecA